MPPVRYAILPTNSCRRPVNSCTVDGLANPIPRHCCLRCASLPLWVVCTVDALLRAGVPLSVQWPFLSWPSTGASLWLHCASMPCRSMLQWASIRRLRCPNCRPCRPPLSRQRPPHRSAPTLTLTAALRLLRVPWRRSDFCFSLLARACCALPVGYPRIATFRGATVGRHVPHRLVWSQFELVP